MMLALLFFFGAAYAQFDIEQPVKWKASLEKVSDGIFEVQAVASMNKAWHTYGLGPYDGGPNPTILTVAGDGVELVGDPYVKQGGKKVLDDVFGMEIDLLEDGDVIAQKVKLGPGAGKIDVGVEWQACTEGSCAPPDEVHLSLSAPVVDGEAPATGKTGSSLWGFILEAIGWGLLALLTPCVFPMIPMTVSFFLKQNEKNPAKGKFMALLYGICIVLIYTIPIAVIILLTRLISGNMAADIFNWIATSWINVIFFLIFVLFALSFFGAFELVLPSSVVNKADSKSNRGAMF